MDISDQPLIYEINTAVFLQEIAAKLGREITLSSIPDETWDEIASLHVDAVWFMGVWRRSPTAQTMAHDDPSLAIALPDLKEEDIIGSAYSIFDYSVNEKFGGNEALAVARQKLKDRGIGLMLDYVPNHVAIDHPWTIDHPEYFVTGNSEDLNDYPEDFFATASGILAKGRDPNFPPWSDVAQLNAFSPELRSAVTNTLLTLSDMCDGVRCDMAMLMMNEVFSETWGKRVGEAPTDDYWPTIIKAIREHRPDFTFLAEVYWHKEKALLEQGFNLCYDKELYDHLVDGSAHAIQKHLRRDANYQKHLLRFIENHDEPRAAKTFLINEHKAAATIFSTLPGARLFHEGEFEGRRVKLPVHLSRRPDGQSDEAISTFYHELLPAIKEINISKSTWSILNARRPFTRRKSHRVVSWRWHNEMNDYIVLVNYSDDHAKVKFSAIAKDGQPAEQIFGSGSIDVGSLLSRKPVTLAPWQYAIVRITK